MRLGERFHLVIPEAALLANRDLDAMDVDAVA